MYLPTDSFIALEEISPDAIAYNAASVLFSSGSLLDF
jgi:hypothetical protein